MLLLYWLSLTMSKLFTPQDRPQEFKKKIYIYSKKLSNKIICPCVCACTHTVCDLYLCNKLLWHPDSQSQTASAMLQLCVWNLEQGQNRGWKKSYWAKGHGNVRATGRNQKWEGKIKKSSKPQFSPLTKKKYNSLSSHYHFSLMTSQMKRRQERQSSCVITFGLPLQHFETLNFFKTWRLLKWIHTVYSISEYCYGLLQQWAFPEGWSH